MPGEVAALFIDMLGFAALVEQYPDAIAVHGGMTEDGESYTYNSSSPSAERFRLFQLVLDRFLERHYPDHPTCKAMLFSDCAFIVDKHVLVCARSAVDLMQAFIGMAIPVRMGIGFGTFNEVRSSSDVREAFSVTRSLFTGTAVARANAAERCGGKGMRIFLHPSLATCLEHISWRAYVLPLDPPYPAAPCELSYLYRALLREEEADKDDRELFRLVGLMWDWAPESVHAHYAATIAALNSMRRILNRSEMVVTTDSWRHHHVQEIPSP
jgi:hypothetical protein